MRCMPMRCMLIRCTFMRYTPMRCTPVRYTSIRHLFMRCMFMNLALGAYYPWYVMTIPQNGGFLGFSFRSGGRMREQ